MRLNRCHADRRTPRRAFTLVEVILAAVITAFIIGSVSMTVGQLARSKNTVRDRLTATLRADTALTTIRSDIISIIRDTDLFYTRFKLIDDVRDTAIGEADRDELLVFNTRLRAVRDLTYQGEGLEYETQYRIQEDDVGPVLWQRRDPVPDQFTLGGGQAHPLVDGIVGLSIEAYDGVEWREQWDSDEDGLPRAVRVTILASGHTDWEDFSQSPTITLRTVIPIDRVVPPMDQVMPTDEEEMLLEEYLTELLANYGAQDQQNPDGEGAGGGNVQPADGPGGQIDTGSGGPANVGGAAGDRPGSSGGGGRPSGAGSGGTGNADPTGIGPRGGSRPRPSDIPPE